MGEPGSPMWHHLNALQAHGILFQVAGLLLSGVFRLSGFGWSGVEPVAAIPASPFPHALDKQSITLKPAEMDSETGRGGGIRTPACGFGDHERSGVRELIVRPYRIAYRIVGSEIRILKIHHSARVLRLDDIEEPPRRGTTSSWPYFSASRF